MCVPNRGYNKPSMLIQGPFHIQYINEEFQSNQLTEKTIDNFQYNSTQSTLMIDGEEVSIEERIYNGANPCIEKNSENIFVSDHYFQFPLDPTFFIQCDQLGNMFIQPCGDDKLWSPKAMICVPNQMPESMDIHAVDAKNIPTLSVSNPCLEVEAHTYYKHPYDETMFIVCDGEVPYTFHCPQGQLWDDYSLTCHIMDTL